MFVTNTDALRHLATVEADLLRGTYRSPQQAGPTVAVWAARHIAAQQGRLTPKTQALNESLLRSSIEPSLGAAPVNQLQKIAVREWVAALTARGLSPSRVRQALVVLSQVIAAAVEDDMSTATRAPVCGHRGSPRRSRGFDPCAGDCAAVRHQAAVRPVG
ncbi:MAG: hypothetical protein NVS3B26_08980 [Mycobacteriales bacterium]